MQLQHRQDERLERFASCNGFGESGPFSRTAHIVYSVPGHPERADFVLKPAMLASVESFYNAYDDN
jgi:hypothetical protein